MTLMNIKVELENALIEREREIELMLLGLVSKQHVLFVGPPGTAKSFMVEGAIEASGLKGFVLQLHKFIPPEEVIGPVKLSELKQDRYERVLKEMLPEAEIAFLDEIWKSSPAILNTLLRILNEREFRNGTAGMISCPLQLCVAASNEWPIGEGFETVGALFDRFLIRASIRPVSRSGRSRLLYSTIPSVKNVSDRMEVGKAQAAVDAVSFGQAAKDAYDKMLDSLANEGIVVGDRRMRAAVSVAKAAAVLEGVGTVEPKHLEPLQHVLWAVPDQEQKCAEIVSKVANPTGWKITEILGDADEAIESINDFTSPEAFAAAKKVKSLSEELDSLGALGNGRATKAKEYIKGRMLELNQRLLGVS